MEGSEQSGGGIVNWIKNRLKGNSAQPSATPIEGNEEFLNDVNLLAKNRITHFIPKTSSQLPDHNPNPPDPTPIRPGIE